MKRAFLLLFFVFNMVSAQNLKDVLVNKNTPITFFGLDFSRCTFVGSESDFNNAQELKNVYIPKWNNFFYSESEKFDIKKFFSKNNVAYEIEVVEETNGAIDEKNMIVNTTPVSFSNTDIEQILTKYKIKSNNQIGLVFIVNSFNKFRRQAVINLVFFNVVSKDILYTKELTSEPRGFGLTNFWMGSVYNFLDQIKGREYKNWKKENK